ncbi:hypothetical protein [Caldimonas taiwanensis]|uniref:hypothetical protein n=1 Tax=Caldimonas taiwanensis TaxID=307483 RepID=UPI0007849226|nr:hypothetical protein [Caldimonas taiwanensis]
MKAPRTERHAAIEGLHTSEGFARIGAGRPLHGDGWPTVKRYPRSLDEIEPARRATSRPVYVSRARRFFAALAAFLLAPSPFVKENSHERRR